MAGRERRHRVSGKVGRARSEVEHSPMGSEGDPEVESVRILWKLPGD